MAAEQRTVSINDLVLIPELSPRARLCEETITRYMDSFPSLPPVRVQSRTNVVVDGYHRVEAAVRLGLEEIPVAEEEIPDEELKLVAGVANVAHGQPLTRAERNQLAVSLVRNYGKLREDVGRLLGMSPSAVTLALREHQYNEMISEKIGSPVQVINSAHVRALYRVGPEQRERLLEAVVTKVDDDGQPYPLTGAELKVLVDRMLDPATPTAELNRLLHDPKARPKPAPAAGSANGAATTVVDPGMPPADSDTRPWEREWDSPLKGGDSEAFDRARSVDEEIARSGGSAAEERQIAELLRRAGAEEPAHGARTALLDAEVTHPTTEADRLREGIATAVRALEELAPKVEPFDVRWQVQEVAQLLGGML